MVKDKKVELIRDFGDDSMESARRLVTRDTYVSFVELYANAWDADANRVEFVYSPAKDECSLSDDGNGMIPEELAYFVRFGDSPKKKIRTSPGGRRMTGLFGAAFSI